MRKIRWHPVILVLLLILIPVQVMPGLINNSLHADEPHHLSAGYSRLVTFGDNRLMPEHGPLIPVISSIPLLFMDVNFPFDHYAWKIKNLDVITRVFLFEYNSNPYEMVFWSRITMLMLSIILGIYIYKWANELYGKNAGLLALFLYSFSPDMLAHSGFVSNDFGLAVFAFISMYYFWKFVREPTWGRLVISGITLGLALLTQLSAILIAIIYVVVIFFIVFSKYDFRPKIKLSIPQCFVRQKSKKAYQLFLSLLLIFFVTYILILVSYKFEGVGKPIASSIREDVHLDKALFNVESYIESNLIAGFVLEKVPSPLPYYYIRGIATNFYYLGGGRAFVYGGEPRSVWFFFIFSFLMKTPIALLVMLIISIVFYFKIKGKLVDELFLILPFLIHHLVFLFISKQFGYRYILQSVPFIFVFTSRIVLLKFNKDKVFRGILVILGLWYVISSVSIHPHYLSYTNEIIGPENIYKYYVESNVDWGQDLFYLRDYLNEKGIENPVINYYGFQTFIGEPILDYYNIDYIELQCGPQEGFIVISVTPLMQNQECNGWLLEETPIDRIGYSMLVYNITAP